MANPYSRPKYGTTHVAKRDRYRAADRIRNPMDELHHKAARFLADNFGLILIPSFETSEMVLRGARKLRAKSVRSMLTYAHYRFRQFLTWKAWQCGKAVMVVNEAYTSKTCSGSGEIIPNLGGRRVVKGTDGVELERGINGARGIFLRALGDSPELRQRTQGASAANLERWSAKKDRDNHVVTPVGQLFDLNLGRQLPGIVQARSSGLVEAVKATPCGQTDAATHNIHNHI